jgi:cell division septation protein DedD
MPTAQDEGVALTQRTVMNFVGAGVLASDDAANNRTLVTVKGDLFGSSTVTFTTSSTNSNIVTVTHNRGATGYAVALTPTTLPPTSVTLVATNKTATSFQVQGVIATKANLTQTFDWILVGP